MKSSGHFIVFCVTGDMNSPHLALAKAIERCIRDLKQALFQDNASVPVFSGDCPLPEV
jgi:hypothetical protein